MFVWLFSVFSVLWPFVEHEARTLIVQFTCTPSLSDATTEAKTLIAGLDKPVVTQKWKGGKGQFLRDSCKEFIMSLKDKHWDWGKM